MNPSNARITAIGDSWFALPRFVTGNLITALQRLNGWRVNNIAVSGWTSEQVLSIDVRQKLESAMPETDILLCSMGGNDLANNLIVPLLDNVGQGAAHALDMARVTTMCEVVKSNYEDVFDLRALSKRDVVIFAHNYAFPYPSGVNVGVWPFQFGPWLKPTLDYCGWTDPFDANAICSQYLRALSDALYRISAEHRNFFVIDTQSVRIGPDDWHDEMHPSMSGWDSLASFFDLQVRQRLASI